MTPARYLLYVDILGFSGLVNHSPEMVPDLYRVIDQLNVWNHPSFRAIAFSDTVLVFNMFEPKAEKDHEYAVMFSCEFAQDLLYRLAGSDVFFRAILVYGAFEDLPYSNLHAFYGDALIDAYQFEKALPAVGLFISEACNSHNTIFPTVRFSRDLHFVYLTQSIERLQYVTQGRLPCHPALASEEDGEFPRVVPELQFLRDIRNNGRKASDPLVRAKHLATYDLYRLRYPELLSKLEVAEFAPETICPSVDWNGRKERFLQNRQRLGS